VVQTPCCAFVLFSKPMTQRTCRSWFTACLLFSCLLAFPSFVAAQRSFFYDTTPILSDFDGDHTVDQAELLSNGTQKDIYVSFGKSSWKSLTFNSGAEDRGRLFSEDLDRDGDTDLIWISQYSPLKYAVWLGDGQGNFSLAAGHDHDPTQSLLGNNRQTHVAENSVDGESDDLLQAPTVIALQPSSSAFHEIQATRSALVTPLTVNCAACLSVVRKRGPPSQLF
jgi:hypothetical protein